MEADRQQVLERALPFREGEEVYLEIVEPHMYSAGDAVAKVDGYIICVRNADSAVGQKRLVRIEQVGRTEAVAVLIDQPPAAVIADAPAGDAVESSVRRRGRRSPARRATVTAGAATAGHEPSSE
jgi:ribonuclease G